MQHQGVFFHPCMISVRPYYKQNGEPLCWICVFAAEAAKAQQQAAAAREEVKELQSQLAALQQQQ
jgi:hypothetical protein